MRRPGAAWIAAVLALCLVATACGGGGNPLIITELFTLFTPNPPSPAPRISMDPGPAAGAMFSIEINASGITDLWGTGFTVEYDPTVATWDSCESLGSILGVSGSAPSNPCDDALVDGAKFFAGLVNATEGQLTVSASRDGAGLTGVPVGTGLLLTLTFTASGSTSSPESFTFKSGSSQEVETCPQDLTPCSFEPNAAFDGGTLTASGG